MTLPLTNQKGNILIVDDTLTNLRLLSTLLTQRGYAVRGVLSGELALHAVAQEPPDVILLDVSMPEMDGYEVCQQLQAQESTRYIPVIFISAFDEVTDKVKGFAVGGTDYITKPFHWAEVVARVENQFKIQELSHELRRKNAKLQREVQERRNAELALQRALEQLKTLANLDGLTKIANRRRFDEYLQHHWGLGLEHQCAIALILCDVDFFKHYNDSYGHLVGDEGLQQVAKTLEQGVLDPQTPERLALVARYGGEEFGILLPNTTLDAATGLAHHLHNQIHQLHIPHAGIMTGTGELSMSFGVASLIPQGGQTPKQLIAQADQALYLAKTQGRDRVVTYDPAAPT